jgi:hypothetical protein
VIRVWPELVVLNLRAWPARRCGLFPVRHDHCRYRNVTVTKGERGEAPDTQWVSEVGSNELAIATAIRPAKLISHLTAAGEGLGFGLGSAQVAG